MGRPSVAAAATLAFCLSCGRGEQPGRTAAPGPVSEPQAGGTLLRRLDADVSTLNPVLASTRYDRLVANYLFTPLIYLDRNLRPLPGLAESWEIGDGGRLYRFRLNPKATFSDGQPVRAADVLFTLRKIVDPHSEAFQVAGGFEQLDLARTRTIDASTLEVAFRRPLASQLLRFNDVLVLPEHVYGNGSFRDGFHDSAVGSGPYRLVRREAGRQIVLEKRADYWREAPWLQRVVFRIISDHRSAWNALKRGEIDETFLTTEVWQRERTAPAVARRVQFLRFYTLNYNSIAWNNRDPILSDRRVRRALAACIPTEAMVRDLYYGTARAVSGPFTPDQFAFNPRVPPIRHDPTVASRVLASAGWRDADGDGVLERGGKPLRVELVIMAGNATTAQFAQLLQAETKKAGVDLRILTLDGALAIQRILAGDYQAAYLSWDLDPDPDPFAIFHSSQFPPRGQNFLFYSNPDVDRLIEQARLELDEERRKPLYWRLHELVAADQPATTTVQSSSRWGINRRVRGVEISPGFGLFLWYPGELGWWIPAGMRGDEAA